MVERVFFYTADFIVLYENKMLLLICKCNFVPVKRTDHETPENDCTLL